MAYAAASDVAALAPNLLSGASEFSASTCPTASEVASWLSAGSVFLDAYLVSLGFEIPTDDAARDLLRIPNALYAVMLAEQSRVMPTTSFGERTRGSVFEKMFDNSLRMLAKMDWGALGAAPLASIYYSGCATGRISGS